MRASGKAVSGDYAVVTLFFAVRTITAECTGPVISCGTSTYAKLAVALKRLLRIYAVNYAVLKKTAESYGVSGLLCRHPE